MMYEVLKDIVETIRVSGPLDGLKLDQLLNAHNKHVSGETRAYSKKRMLPYYLELRRTSPDLWEQLDIDDDLEPQIFATLRMKPRRTASGVATITVITKPHPCSGNCLYCPNDVRMPKSYLHREPACQRAERNFFDPYLQVRSRLRALTEMGHACDKVEIIVLGGSWTDYPERYRLWFMTELFRALNTPDEDTAETVLRKKSYSDLQISSDDEELEKFTAHMQSRVNVGTLSYNEAVKSLYGKGSAWEQASKWQEASYSDLEKQHAINESSRHRVVGLVVETRPEALDARSLRELRSYGCTKVQIGVQTLRPETLSMNNRYDDPGELASAFELLRVFGFKLHTHFMLNLYGATIEDDADDYLEFIQNPTYRPDEIKLYPCVLVEGTGLQKKYMDGSWTPYPESELIDLLAQDMRVTPPYTRISRMIRDISAEDIIAGSKKTNLRQMVEMTDVFKDGNIEEIRSREIASSTVDIDELQLDEIIYDTSNTTEYFLQWISPEGRIAGFLRLSLPSSEYMRTHQDEIPHELGHAMIREVHVYGHVANLHRTDGSAQHLGLGRKLIDRACEIASDNGFDRINVISSVGTRNYYRKLGFLDGDMYQYKVISEAV